MSSVQQDYQSRRLKFIALNPTMQQHFTALYRNEIVMSKIMPCLSTDQAAKLFERLYRHKPITFWGIYLQSDLSFLGVQGFLPETKGLPESNREFGILLDPAAFGKGIAFESVSRMLAFGFQRMSLTKAYAYFDRHNIAIEKIAKRLNFKVNTSPRSPIECYCSISSADFLAYNPEVYLD
ncbi:GNAT family N-acetyltransferase [Aliiglaciecola sp. LCG003]|uniref:GNAT family N-acetyltransferase n=1 Tax=Aliiglaciecola sp. LCG003 TaxID=3053655 RepID=UPI00257448DB|nr:GNAT family N-acetyltransferase [Aliiglaciecola sp. LCG003]WJG07812.1 GNAT family N-acetyltransferase [Aliiglaciecola sp. LCG003]